MSRRPDRGTRRASPGQAGSTGARGGILLAIAVVLGIVLLNGFDRVPGSDSVDVDSILDGLGTSTTAAGGGPPVTAAPAVTSTTRASRAPADVTVLVANGTDIKGLAGATATALKAIGYNTLSPSDTSRTVDVTKVQYSAGFEAEGRAVATSLQLPPTAVEASTPANAPPVADTLGANVIVVLGADVATKATTTTTGAGAGATTSTTRR